MDMWAFYVSWIINACPAGAAEGKVVDWRKILVTLRGLSEWAGYIHGRYTSDAGGSLFFSSFFVILQGCTEAELSCTSAGRRRSISTAVQWQDKIYFELKIFWNVGASDEMTKYHKLKNICNFPLDSLTLNYEDTE